MPPQIAITAGHSDAELISRVRDGDDAAYGELYRRTIGPATGVARSMLIERADADDAVAEVFAATYSAIRRGRGPIEAFGPYVLSSVRHECRRWWRRGARRRAEGVQVIEVAGTDDFAATDERDVLLQALDALPAHQRDVLWLSEVVGLSYAQIAARSGSTTAAVAQLAVRARRAFAERYLHAHMAKEGEVTAGCTVARSVLAEIVRGTASRARRLSALAHLDECASCRSAYDDLALVNARLRTSPLVVLSAGVATGRVGIVARFVGWVSGPAASLSTAAGLAVVSAAVPAATLGERRVEAAPPAVVAEPIAVRPPVVEPRTVRAEPLEVVAVPHSPAAFEARPQDVEPPVAPVAPTTPPDVIAPPQAPTPGAISTAPPAPATSQETPPPAPASGQPTPVAVVGEAAAGVVDGVVMPVASAVLPVVADLPVVAEVLPTVEQALPIVTDVLPVVTDVLSDVTELPVGSDETLPVQAVAEIVGGVLGG